MVAGQSATYPHLILLLLLRLILALLEYFIKVVHVECCH